MKRSSVSTRHAQGPRAWRGGLALLLAGCAAGLPARAADPPALKETLGKVQSDAEAKAVEDLIDKLKGVSRKPAPVTPPPAATVPVPGTPKPAVAAPVPTPSQAPPAPAATAPPEPPAGKVASPATPEVPAVAPDVKPDEAVKRAELSKAPSIDLEIFFEYNSAEITPVAAAALTPLGRALSDARLAGDRFLVAGHTDAKGGADYNLALSQRRAEAVRQFLIGKFGIEDAKLLATGMGSKHLKNAKQPLAAANRRVQIVNLSKDEPGKPAGK
jgi:outer membrane protein OmpA-like peptidoglycan-associated protein